MTTPRIVKTLCERCDGEGTIDGERCVDCDGFGSYSVFEQEAEAPVAPPTVEEDPRPIALQLLTPRRAEDADAEVWVRCLICGRQTKCPKQLVDFIRVYNRKEIAQAEATAESPYPHRPNPISTGEIVVCDDPACLMAKRAQIAKESAEYFRLLDVYAAQMKRGELTVDGEVFLRRHGYAESIEAYRKKQEELQAKREKKKAKEAEKTAEAPKTEREKSIADRPLDLDPEPQGALDV